MVALVAGAGTALLARRRVDAGQATERARTAALAAADAAVPDVLGYDYRTLDAGFARAAARLAPPFLDQYRTTTSTVVAPTRRQYQAVVTAQVRAASVVSASPRQAVVLLFVDQATTSTRIQGTRVDQDRVRMTLVPGPHGWLVSAVDAL